MMQRENFVEKAKTFLKVQQAGRRPRRNWKRCEENLRCSSVFIFESFGFRFMGPVSRV